MANCGTKKNYVNKSALLLLFVAFIFHGTSIITNHWVAIEVWTREDEKYFLEGGFWSFCAINELNSSAPIQCYPMTYLFYGDGSPPNAIKNEWRIIELSSEQLNALKGVSITALLFAIIALGIIQVTQTVTAKLDRLLKITYQLRLLPFVICLLSRVFHFGGINSF